MAVVRDINLALFNEADGKVLVRMSWNIVGGADDIARKATYRQLVELMRVDDATPADQVIQTLLDTFVAFDDTHTSDQQSYDARVDAGTPQVQKIRARVQLMAAFQSDVVILGPAS